MKKYLISCFCTPETNSGNPAAVITDFTGTDTERLALAKQINMPVTVFISDINSPEPHIQFFYPDAEMQLCLHGTLAAARMIFDIRKENTQLTFSLNVNKKINVFKTNADTLHVKVSAQEAPVLEIDPNEISQLLNIQLTELNSESHLMLVSSVGSPKLLIPLNTLSQLNKLKPDYFQIKEWSLKNKVNGLYVYANEGASHFSARGFNPRTGHNEDAATGVAAAALALALKQGITVNQGNSINKQCSINVRFIDPTNILVGGRVSEPVKLE